MPYLVIWPVLTPDRAACLIDSLFVLLKGLRAVLRTPCPPIRVPRSLATSFLALTKVRETKVLHRILRRQLPKRIFLYRLPRTKLTRVPVNRYINVAWTGDTESAS
ncbi:hypothetical protein RB195_014288 [Necator americanus]|uniref:Secreted protein n=1 Tax=Necator americanus TaxID=51031 RepID=A0ABR1DZU9_NECAM